MGGKSDCDRDAGNYLGDRPFSPETGTLGWDRAARHDCSEIG